MKDRNVIIVETFDRVASAYQDKFMDFDLYNDGYDLICRLIREGGTMIDVGCGPGNISKYVASKRPDVNITMIDTAPNMLKLAKLNVPNAQCQLCDARSIRSLGSNFDAILFGFCFPYLSKDECIAAIADSYAMLNDDGLIYFSYIEDHYSKSGYEKSTDQHDFYVFYHQADYLRDALQQHRFKVVAEYGKTYLRGGGISELHTIIIAQKLAG